MVRVLRGWLEEGGLNHAMVGNISAHDYRQLECGGNPIFSLPPLRNIRELACLIALYAEESASYGRRTPRSQVFLLPALAANIVLGRKVYKLSLRLMRTTYPRIQYRNKKWTLIVRAVRLYLDRKLIRTVVHK